MNLEIMPRGAFEKIGGYRPFGLQLSGVKPAGLTKAPEMASPQYGAIKVGAQQFLVAMDGKDKLYVDENGNGDLTDDPPTDWGMKTIHGRNGKDFTERMGTATVDLKIGGKTVPCEIGMYESQGTIGYYMDFYRSGKVTLDGKPYEAVYIDESAAWDGTKGIFLLNEKGDGKFGPQIMHQPGQPFMFAGKEYEFGPLNGGYGLKYSKKKIVAPVERDPNESNGLKAGSVALTFHAVTTGGKQVTFPESFKGKVVMLDFWATWCGPCMHEVPNVVKAYSAFHEKGFEVLGVSLDQPNQADTVKDVTGKQGMVWGQIYDGGAFKAAVAQQYKIQAIPEAYLVDGDTGKIIACGDAIRGEKLEAAISKALAAKQGAKPR